MPGERTDAKEMFFDSFSTSDCPVGSDGVIFETRLNLDFAVTALDNPYLSFSVWRMTQNKCNRSVFQIDADNFYFWICYKILILR